MKKSHKCHIVLINLKDSAFRAGFLTEYLAFGYLAGALRVAGHKVTWIDEHADPAPGQEQGPESFDFRSLLPVDIVGMSPSYATYRRALDWLGCWKRISPGIVTVLGGQHAMMVPGEILGETDVVDFVCLGEGEVPLCELADCIHARKRPDRPRGFAWKESKSVYYGDPVDLSPDMDDLAFPARDSLEKWIARKKISQVSLQNSRGCPYHCTFCHFPVIRKKGHGYDGRWRSPGNAVAELVYLQNKYGFREFFFNSPQFGGIGGTGRRWMLDFADALLEANRDIRFEIECRSDTLDDPGLVKRLKRAGLVRVFLGLEAGGDETLRRFGKGISADVNRRVIKLLEHCQVSVSGSGFIMLHPLSTLEELRLGAEFLREIGETHIGSLWSTFRMFPGIRQNKTIEAEGLADKGRKHDQVKAYRFADPRVARLAANASRALGSSMLAKAIRCVRLVDIEIGLEEANLPAVNPDVAPDKLEALSDIRDSGRRLRNCLVTAFFDHFLYCLRLANKEGNPDAWQKAGDYLHRHLCVLRPKIQRLLDEHDVSVLNLIHGKSRFGHFNDKRAM